MATRVPQITINLTQQPQPAQGQCSYCNTTKAVNEFVKCHCNLVQYCDLRCKKLHGRVHRFECENYNTNINKNFVTMSENYSAYKQINDEAGAINQSVAAMMERKDISDEEMKKFMTATQNRLATLSIQLQRVITQDPFQPK